MASLKSCIFHEILTLGIICIEISIINKNCKAEVSTSDKKQICTSPKSVLVQRQTSQQQQSSENKMIQFLAYTKHSPCFSAEQEIFLRPAVLAPVAFFLHETAHFLVTFQLPYHTLYFVGCVRKWFKKDADIIWKLWNTCPNGNIIISCIETYIYRQMYLRISRQHWAVYILI